MSWALTFDKALECANSRRIAGQSHIQLSLKAPARQARPLTVNEVRVLHNIADGEMYSKVDRCIASSLLLLMYGRCRVSDVNYIHEILHDLTGGTGFLEISTRYHKAARTAQQKAMLLPIVISSCGVVQLPWVHARINNRKACGLPTSGLVQGALLPAPALGEHVAWLKRPLSPGEVTNILKGFLQCSDQNLSSHSLKATTLSWAAKCELPPRATSHPWSPCCSSAGGRHLLQQRHEHRARELAAESHHADQGQGFFTLMPQGPTTFLDPDR